jgi:hypothetical protein
MTNPARKFMGNIAQFNRTPRPTLVAHEPTQEPVPTDDLSRAKRALWSAEERFKAIIRRSAHIRHHSARIEHALDESHKGLAVIRAFFEGQ